MKKIGFIKSIKYWNIKSSLSIICYKCDSIDKMIFKEEESVEILKILGLVNNMNERYML